MPKKRNPRHDNTGGRTGGSDLSHLIQDALRLFTRDWLLLIVAALGGTISLLDIFGRIGFLQDKAGPAAALSTSFLLMYVVIERRSVLDPLERSTAGVANALADIRDRCDTRIEVLRTREGVYGAIAKVFDEVATKPVEERRVHLGAMHGTADRSMREPEEIALAAFDRWMYKALNDQSWEVRLLYDVSSVKRLDQIAARLGPYPSSMVKLLPRRDTVESLSPLIIGLRHVFLGLSDDQLWRVSEVIHIESEAAARVGEDYFLRLWDRSDATLVCEGKGKIEAGLAKVRRALNADPS